MALVWLTELLIILESKRMPCEWRMSVLIAYYKNKGDTQNNYRIIKLMMLTVKLLGDDD